MEVVLVLINNYNYKALRTALADILLTIRQGYIQCVSYTMDLVSITMNTMKSHIRDQIKINSLDMPVGSSEATHCPFCGATHERSFSITRTEQGILYHCFRVKCHESGFIPALDKPEKPTERKRYRHFTRPLRELSDEIYDWLYDTYGLEKGEIELARWKEDFTFGRLYMPIINEHGLEGGAVAKRLWVDVEIERRPSSPKVLTYFWSENWKLHVAPTEVDTGPIVVVEDIISATKVARHARSAALLGTAMTAEQAQRLRLLSTNITLALDADTWHNSSSIAHKFKNKYGLLFENFRIVKLSYDPKSMTDEEIKEVILNEHK